jgi:PBS lyase HEAT-like repeat
LGGKGKDVAELKTVEEAIAARDPVALSRLLLDDSHESHEDIVFELGLIGDPCAVSAITKAVRISFAHLTKWNNLHEFQRKCAYALARIGTPESRAALESLVAESDPFLKEYGKEGLQNWPMPFEE